MQAPTGPIRVRESDVDDLRQVRALITRTLLEAGYDPPAGESDEDLLDPSFYAAEGRRLWVAVDEHRRIVGCVAVMEGDQQVAVLRRLAGSGVYGLIAAAVQFARRQRYDAAEVVLAPGIEDAQLALRTQGFAPASPSGSLLYRRELTSE